MEQVIVKQKVISSIQFLAILGIIIFAQAFLKNQLVLGSIINTILILTVFYLGLWRAVGIAILPSVFALILGFLPTLLAPFIPFIILGNIILVCMVYLLKNYWAGAILGAVFKFGFLFFSSAVIFNLLFNQALPEKVLLMMSYPQLFTALAGGLLAFIILRIFKYEKK